MSAKLTCQRAWVVVQIERGTTLDAIARALDVHPDTLRELVRRMRDQYGAASAAELPAAVRAVEGRNVDRLAPGMWLGPSGELDD